MYYTEIYISLASFYNPEIAKLIMQFNLDELDKTQDVHKYLLPMLPDIELTSWVKADHALEELINLKLAD